MDDRVTPTDYATMKQIGESAEAYFRNGECCVEAVVHATIDHLAPDTPPEVVAMVQGLCGGMGNKRATCGVFTGGAVAIGIAAKAREVPLTAEQIKKITARYLELLEQEWGGHTCDELLKGMGISNWNRSQCRRLTIRGAELVAELMAEES